MEDDVESRSARRAVVSTANGEATTMGADRFPLACAALLPPHARTRSARTRRKADEQAARRAPRRRFDDAHPLADGAESLLRVPTRADRASLPDPRYRRTDRPPLARRARGPRHVEAHAPRR